MEINISGFGMFVINAGESPLKNILTLLSLLSKIGRSAPLVGGPIPFLTPRDKPAGERKKDKGQVAANRRWREKNREKYNAYMREYRRRNK